jgi:hypothetical protein
MPIHDKGKIISAGLMSLGIMGFIIFILLVIVNYTIVPILPFLPVYNTPTIDPSMASIHTQTIYTNKPAPSNTSLVFDNIVEQSNKFTISFDCYLNGTYISTDVPRVVLYLDISNNATSSSTISASNFKEYTLDTPLTTNILTSTNTNILSQFPNTNFIVYVDSVKNDMKVAFITTDSTNKYLEILPTINNIPINDIFQITVVFTGKIAEIYYNKQLIHSYRLINKPITLSPSNKYTFYSPISFIKYTIQIGNIQYFDTSITSSQVRTLTNPIMSTVFFTKTN